MFMHTIQVAIKWLKEKRKHIKDDDPSANMYDAAISALSEFVSVHDEMGEYNAKTSS
jgi:hypothetical protein